MTGVCSGGSASLSEAGSVEAGSVDAGSAGVAGIVAGSIGGGGGVASTSGPLLPQPASVASVEAMKMARSVRFMRRV